MKKVFFIGATSLAIASFSIGYKCKEFIRDSIYLPIRSAIVPTNIPSFYDYKEAICPTNAISIATFGQSNSANHMTEKSKSSIPQNLYQYDWKSNKCYAYKEPLLGSSGMSGNTVTFLASKIANNTEKPVVITPFGIGARSVLNWAYGDLSYQHTIVMERIKQSNLTPDLFLWHQGESDAKHSKSSEQDLIDTPYFHFNKTQTMGLEESTYYDALTLIVKKTFRQFPKTYFGIALASYCSTRPKWQPIRNAQSKVAKDLSRAFILADSDEIIGLSNRPDGCHFSSKGSALLGKLYHHSIIKELNLYGLDKQ